MRYALQEGMTVMDPETMQEVPADGQTMGEIVASVQRVTDIMSEISAASQEQSAGIEQVNQTVTQMDEATLNRRLFDIREQSRFVPDKALAELLKLQPEAADKSPYTRAELQGLTDETVADGATERS